MKTILHVNTTMNIGGIETLLLNISKKIDKNKYKFIFLCYKNEKYDLEEAINQLGFEFIKISNPNMISKLKHLKEIIKVLKENKVDIIHIHTYFDSAYVSLAARICKIKKIIVHSHTTIGKDYNGIKERITHWILKKIICFCSTDCIACSKEAGESLFLNKKFIILENGIDLKKFSFNNKKRKEIRSIYNVEKDEILIGHIGRFNIAKNHEFMIEVFKKIVEQNSKFKLMFVGNGELKDKIMKKVKNYHLTDKVIFTGEIVEVQDYYNAFDSFLFPSIFEGLGISLIEAQANGLTCLVSENVPKAAKLTNTVIYINLNDGYQEWASILLNCSKEHSCENLKLMESSAYNIDTIVEKLETIYER